MTAPCAAFSAEEMMIIAASRGLHSDDVCFVGIGAPSAASNLARLTHAPGITLIYESGTVAAKPSILPLSIGDGELCETALTTVPVTEMFRYWLQGGKMTVGFLGGAQVDRFGNINTTVIGPYNKPKVRLPGGGGAPEIAAQCAKTFLVMRQSKRAFVETIDFRTSFGFGSGGSERRDLGIQTAGPQMLVTDLAVWRPCPVTYEFEVVSLHPGVTCADIQNSVGWTPRFAEDADVTAPPSDSELAVLRDLRERTRRARSRS